ncbi:MAG: hydrogen gas-evolving membrane-bound hydrogenase subunit E [Aminivibrio sp.]|jgi:multisubunit Na+/H+ antiporter MnhB subunit
MKKYIFIVSAIILGALVCGALDNVHPYGDPGKAPMDDYFLANAYQSLSTQNIVTSIVFDYRGFDTIGEAAVLFTAVCAVGALFREGRGKR